MSSILSTVIEHSRCLTRLPESLPIQVIRQIHSNPAKYTTSSRSTVSSPMEMSDRESSHSTPGSLANCDPDNDGVNLYFDSAKTISTITRIERSLDLCSMHRKEALSYLETCKCYYAPVYGKDIYGIIQCLQRQEIPSLILNHHDLQRVDTNSSHGHNGHHTGTGDMISKLLQLLESIVQSSKDVENDAENIHRVRPISVYVYGFCETY